jgi:hypothetical protein
MTCLGGCQGQGEGEQCNRLAGNNGNDDCQSGLVCNTSVVSTPGFGRCCPTDRTQATTAICKGNVGFNANPQPPDAGTDGTMGGNSSDSGEPNPADDASE